MGKTAQPQPILPRIFSVRGKKVVLDARKLISQIELSKVQAGLAEAHPLVDGPASHEAGYAIPTASSVARFVRSGMAVDAPPTRRGDHMVGRLQLFLDAPDDVDDSKPKIGFHRGNR